MPNALIITGETYGKLTALHSEGSRVFPSGQRRTLWRFRCECGQEVVRTLFDVRRADVKSCGCARLGRPAPNRLPEGESGFRALYSIYRSRAKRLGVPFELTVEGFRSLTKAKCYYCNAKPTQRKLATATSHGAYRYNGIDRLESHLGYVAGNVAPCCGTCNQAKNKMGVSEFLDWIRRVYRWSCYED